MTTNKEKRLSPPYLPYRTFDNLVQRLKTGGVPSRIDRSVISSFSGTVQAQILTTLRYLNLTNDQGSPTDKLEKLVFSDGAEKQKILKEILTCSYLFLFKEGIDLNKITHAQITELFIAAGTSGDTTRKSIKFFITAAREAGIALSPHLKKTRQYGPRKGGNKIKKTSEEKHDDDLSSEESLLRDQSPNNTWQHLLLAKFPSFDPNWPAEVQAKWFDGFKELMAQFKKKNE